MVKQRERRREEAVERSSEGVERSLNTASAGYSGESSSMGCTCG